jgi:malonyl-CoA O-methyltransferase
MLADNIQTSDYQSSMSDNQSLTYYPAGNQKLHPDPIVLIHGWGANSEIWQDLPQKLSEFADVYTLDLPGFAASPVIRDYTEQSVNSWLDNQLPQRCYLIGLSLGGMLCRSFAAQYPNRVLGVVTISTNLKFVADKQYVCAMSDTDFEQFSAIWHQNPSACLNRFAGLQAQGDQQQRQLSRRLRSINSQVDAVAGKDMLRLLADLDGNQHITHMSCPALAIFGGKDCLVPVAAATQLPQSYETLVVDTAAHLPHLTAKTEVLQKISEFINKSRYQLDKDQIAQSFGRAANTYDSAAHIQKWSGNQLLKGLNPLQHPKSIADLGCGTGTQTALLKNKFPQAQVTGVDFSAPMLDYAKANQEDRSLKWLCCDAEDLALDDQSEDLVFSNFALQWCNDLSPSLAEIYRVLKPQGEFHFAIPGPKTLWELRQVWSQVDEDIHINRFLSCSQWQRALELAGFKNIDLGNTTKIEYHASVKDLLWNLKTVGATNHNSGKSKRLTGKKHINRLYEAYGQFKTSENTFPATWDIIFGYAVK